MRGGLGTPSGLRLPVCRSGEAVAASACACLLVESLVESWGALEVGVAGADVLHRRDWWVAFHQ